VNTVVPPRSVTLGPRFRVANSAGGACSLVEVAKSMFDKQWRDVQMLRPAGTPPCRMQLDWPHEGATMRDGTVGRDKNTIDYPSGATCNVFDRLPPFRYRYTPSGKMSVRDQDRASGRSSVDEGGSCHMGPAARKPPGPSLSGIETRRCRTVSKNRTHIDAVCENGHLPDVLVTMPRYLEKKRDQKKISSRVS
jgi:hypothetical protein